MEKQATQTRPRVQIGDYIFDTPRFMRVRICAIFERYDDAIDCGYTEPTHYSGEGGILIFGKPIGEFGMRFAAVHCKGDAEPSETRQKHILFTWGQRTTRNAADGDTGDCRRQERIDNSETPN